MLVLSRCSSSGVELLVKLCVRYSGFKEPKKMAGFSRVRGRDLVYCHVSEPNSVNRFVGVLLV